MSARELEKNQCLPWRATATAREVPSNVVLHFRQVISRHLLTMSVIAVVTGLGVAHVDYRIGLLSPLIAHPRSLSRNMRRDCCRNCYLSTREGHPLVCDSGGLGGISLCDLRCGRVGFSRVSTALLDG